LFMMLKTVFILFLLDFLSATFLPTVSNYSFAISFNLIVITYLSLHLLPSYLPFIILIINLFHSVFSIEGWALGTFVGCLISYIILILREMMQFTSYLMISLLMLFVQMLWSFISGFTLSLKTQEWEWLIVYARHSIWQAVLLSLLAPLFFMLLNKIWSRKDDESQDTNSSSSIENLS